MRPEAGSVEEVNIATQEVTVCKSCNWGDAERGIGDFGFKAEDVGENLTVFPGGREGISRWKISSLYAVGKWSVAFSVCTSHLSRQD